MNIVPSETLRLAVKASLIPAKLTRFSLLYRKYREYTQANRPGMIANLLAVSDFANVAGCVVECGVWKGGMSAAMAQVLGPDRQYFLFDSFEGLPPAQEIDGERAKRYQTDTGSPRYFDNCRTDESFAERAMKLSGAKHYRLVKGWFNQTLPSFKAPEPIAVLRIDADWYDSVLTCLRYLVPFLAPGAVVILDDYFCFEGCSKAVHQYLTETQSPARITTAYRHVCVVRDMGRTKTVPPSPNAADENHFATPSLSPTPN
jgi:O-methyltransferase